MNDKNIYTRSGNRFWMIVLGASSLGLMSELLLGELAGYYLPELKAAILTSILALVLLLTVLLAKTSWAPVCSGGLIVFFKIMSQYVFKGAVLWNSIAGVSIYWLSFLVVFILFNKKKTVFFNVMKKVFITGMMSSILFYFAGMNLFPCKYLLTFAGKAGFLKWLLYESFVSSAISSLFCAVFVFRLRNMESWIKGLNKKQILGFSFGFVLLMILNIVIEGMLF